MVSSVTETIGRLLFALVGLLCVASGVIGVLAVFKGTAHPGARRLAGPIFRVGVGLVVLTGAIVGPV
jgi:hypothetical protein